MLFPKAIEISALEKNNTTDEQQHTKKRKQMSITLFLSLPNTFFPPHETIICQYVQKKEKNFFLFYRKEFLFVCFGRFVHLFAISSFKPWKDFVFRNLQKLSIITPINSSTTLSNTNKASNFLLLSF